ncbi:uncharacterized protein LOC112341201 [Selaginella moellendorffii]|uniref:uncharacterized protein LOC112341201 n=1 Tax=Selaginella moellendorffii TaxID=88036 RepID=UPI000D1CF8CB|nr:uncharacterized protein LOC112341201 [Selaginella moellendorffii]|eukprot:XP_024516716.1 uncharacterized protein LOC112341201 [Selaginella moellendorffii]
MLHKGRGCKEEVEAGDARLLKPWIWGEEFRGVEDAKRAPAPASNVGKKQLDLNAPLLSVRRNRDGAPGECGSRGDPNPRSSARTSRRSSSFSQRPLVPFFTWELPPPRPPIESIALREGDDRAVTGYGGDQSDATTATALVLAPPPETTSKKKGRKETTSFLEFADARSDFAHTETLSIAPTYMVSELGGGEEEGEDREDGGEWDCNEEEAMAMVEYNSSDRDMIMQRFLPAAKAVAREMAQQTELAWRRPLIAHPSPQGHQYRKEQHHHPPPRPEKKSFAELIKMHDDAGNSRSEPRRSGGLRDSEGGDGDLSSQRYTTIVGSVCGFFPLLRMIQASGNEGRGSSSSPRRARASKKKLEVERESLDCEDDGDESCSTEWWSDEGGDGGRDENDLEDESSEFRKNTSYLACRYTPSRGGLKSPAMVESKGFLGMPRDRRVGSTFIKRMYPIVKSDSKTAAKFQTNSRNATSNPANGNESDSSESLTSIQLSRRASRQNSYSGGLATEKVFCLDTLDQMRQGVLTETFDPAKPVKTMIKSSRNKSANALDERGIHPGVVIPDESFSSMGSKQRVEEDRLFIYVPSKTKITASSTVTPRSSKNNPFGEAEDREDHDKSPSNARIYWGESDDSRDLREEIDGASIALPVPRGPSESWLREKLVKAPGKPPLARRNLLVSTGKSANF